MQHDSILQRFFSLFMAPSFSNAFSQRPWRERLRFALAVFFLFCTVGVLSVMINHTAAPMPVRYVLAIMLSSGVFAGIFILIFGRLALMVVWIMLFTASMFVIGRWGTSLQKETQVALIKPQQTFASEEAQATVEAFQIRVRHAIMRDAVLTLAMIVLSYIAFIQAFNREWEKRDLVEAELKIARRIQEGLLPPAQKRLRGWHMCGVLLPANTVAGDYFDYLEFADGAAGVLVADGSGHGVAAGLLMTMMKSQLFSLTTEPHDTEKFFAQLNRCVRTLAPKNMFVTAAYVALSQNQSGKIEFATVGHPPILRYAAARNVVEELSTPVAALGLQANLPLAPRALTLERDDVLLLYTDGIFEQMNPAKEQWGMERLKAALHRHHDLPLTELCARLVQAVSDFRSYATIHDDITLVAIRREA